MHQHVRRPLAVLAGAALLAGGLVAVTERAALAAPVNDCHSTDNGAPLVTGFDASPNPVDVSTGPATVTITMHVTDAGGPGPATGIHDALLAYSTDTGQSLGVRLHPGDGDAWQGELTVPQYARWTKIRPGIGFVTDGAGNRVYFDTPFEADSHVPPTITVTSTPRDTTKPLLTDFRIAKKTVHPGKRLGHVRLSAEATDDLSGVDSVQVLALSKRRPYAGDFALRVETTLTRVADTSRFEGTMRVPSLLGDRRWRMGVVDVRDLAGNHTQLDKGDLDAAGLDSSFGVVAGTDRVAPVIRSLQVRPATLDVRTGSTMATVRVVASDTFSGVRAVTVSALSLPGDLDEVPLHRVSGTPRRGVWQASLEIPHCLQTRGTHSVHDFSVTVQDWGTAVARRRTKVEILSTKSLGPIGRNDDDFPPAQGPLAAIFAGPVQGVSTEEVHVTSADADGNFDPDAEPLDGTWTCWSGPQGTGPRTSCHHGEAQKVAFTPAAPLDVRHDYYVEFAPDGHLGVTDLVGNPVYSRLRFYPGGL